MKKLFYFGVAGLAIFEILNVYFIMPMPGSQRMNSLDVAYFLYSYRWLFRVLFLVMIVVGAMKAFSIRHKWIPALALVPAVVITYFFNFEMTADHMFVQPNRLTFEPREGNTMSDSSVVVGVEYNGETKAYPIRFIVYHHQVQDTVGGKPVIVTYCSVCRTGRVFEPLVNGKPEKFRLVGMDHFNAMFEDETTKSWWRQVNGEAVAGSLKGNALPEVESFQVRTDKLFALYPNAKIMQLDEDFKDSYDTLGKFERGKSKGQLTRTDSAAWQDKSWVVGVQVGESSKAYDWTSLKKNRIINDRVGEKPIVVALAGDNQSFAVFERPSDADEFVIHNDTLSTGTRNYDFSGRALGSEPGKLKRINAYQEFWHSWRTFHEGTLKYDSD